MSVVIKSSEVNYKDPNTGNYVGLNVLAEQKTSELLNRIEAKGQTVISDIPASYDDLNNIVADSYDSTKTYSVGDYVRYYDGTHDKLYRCITAIATAEAWTSSHWTEVVMADEVSELKNAINSLASDYTIVEFFETVSGTKSATKYPTLPKGRYVMTIGNVQSSDTDKTTCAIYFLNGGAGGTMVTRFTDIARTSNQTIEFELDTDCDAVTFYASTANAYSTGDTFTFTNVKISLANLKNDIDDLKEATAEINNIKSAINGIPVVTEQTTGNIFGIWFDGYYKTVNSGDTAFVSDANYKTTLIPVAEGDRITIDASGGDSDKRLYVYFDSSMQIVPNSRSAGNLTGKRTITAPEGSSYIAINNVVATQSNGYYAYKGTAIKDTVATIQEIITTIQGNITNLSNADTRIESEAKRYYNPFNLLMDAKFTPESYYNTSYHNNEPNYFVAEVQVEANTEYTISPRVRFISKAGTNLETYSGGTTSNVTFTPDFTGTLYVTFNASSSNVFICKTSDVANYGAFSKYFLAQVTGTSEYSVMSQKAITDAITNASKSELYGKKWVACGDSFTKGDFTGIDDPTEYKFQNNPYSGKNKVYPYFIGRRTGAVIVNEAIGGSTMTYIDGTHNEFSTPNGRYTQIPEDADYITLYFGINDAHNGVDIGHLDDNDEGSQHQPGNTTFYGAWNIVMKYLIANHPSAKIGIIISNGCASIDYPNAEIAIAKKYGVAYFDMNGDPKIPLVFRVNGKPDLSQSIKDIRNEQYRVSETNNHPNVACHEDESTFIQAWLERI